jgi:hypothetical protein
MTANSKQGNVAKSAGSEETPPAIRPNSSEWRAGDHRTEVQWHESKKDEIDRPRSPGLEWAIIV